MIFKVKDGTQDGQVIQFFSLEIYAKQYEGNYGGEEYHCTESDKWWKILHDKKGYTIGEPEQIDKPKDLV